MLNLKLISKILGSLLWIEGLLLLNCLVVSLWYQSVDVMPFVWSILITVGTGFLFRLLGRNADNLLGRRDAYFVVTVAWILFTLFGTLPFMISGYIHSFTDAFFEAMSGFTTTGATIIDYPERLPKGLLYWRSLTQWIGGLGIVFFTIAILPSIVGGSVKVFAAEATGPIEETFELADALLKNDSKNICKELGDVMEHVVFYSMLGQEKEEFDVADVCNAQSDKLMFRHDFIDWTGWEVTRQDMAVNANGQVVYKDELKQQTSDNQQAAPNTATQVESTWEQRKQRERDGNKSVLSGVPESLPSLIKAYRIQDKARNVGFDWEEKEQVWDKVYEELGELKAELQKEDKERSTEEFGDFMFSLINAARLYHINPDNALEHTNQKFIKRFDYIEKKAREKGVSIKDLTLAEMDQYWEEAKKL